MFGAGVRAYVCVELVDMRKSIDGLSQLVQPLFSADAFGGQVFVFLGKRRDKVNVETRTNPATGASETIVTETSRYERDFLISGQVGWQLDPTLAVRVGLFDNTGGLGADYRLNERLLLTGEAFDFGQRRDDNPHLRVYGEYTLRKEKPRTPRLFVTSGVDNALNDTAFTFGGGLRWRDEDLKYLIGSIPIGK